MSVSMSRRNQAEEEPPVSPEAEVPLLGNGGIIFLIVGGSIVAAILIAWQLWRVMRRWQMWRADRAKVLDEIEMEFVNDDDGSMVDDDEFTDRCVCVLPAHCQNIELPVIPSSVALTECLLAPASNAAVCRCHHLLLPPPLAPPRLFLPCSRSVTLPWPRCIRRGTEFTSTWGDTPGGEQR